MKKIKKEEFITTNWSGGTTSEIYISPKDSSVGERNFDYRISSATCDLDESIFSDYSGFDRYITPLDGELKLKNGKEEVSIEPYQIYKFDGSDKVAGYSKIRDYNLIFKTGLRGNMYTLYVSEKKELVAKTKTLIFNYDSEVKVNEEEFEKFSAILIEKDESLEFLGEGNLLVCEI